MGLEIDKIKYTGESKIIKRLCERINEIIDAAGSGGGSGSNVVVNPVLQSGTKIAEITVDDEQSDVYAPTPPTKTSDLTNDSGFITSSALPTKLSDLTNDAGFITNTVSNLTNYYTKSQTYTQAEVDALISAMVTLNVLVVQTLPLQNISTTTIYLVPKAQAETNDIYDEYIYVNGSWEHIGSTSIDLSNYYTKAQVDNLLADKVDKKTTLDAYYGTCPTAAATVAKVITVTDGASNFTLRAGVTITVKFTYTNTAQNPTFNVNGTGAKRVWYNTALLSTSSLGYAGTSNRPMQFVYDGTQWVFIGWSIDSNTTYATMSTAEMLAGTATNQRSVTAATLNPAVQALSTAYGTCTGQAANQNKVATIADANWTLRVGAFIAIKFDANNTYSATAAAPVTLNVNGTGAKQIYGANSAAPTGTNTTYFGRANYLNYYVYDGTYWVWAGSSADNNTTYTNMTAAEIEAGTFTTGRSISAKVLNDWMPLKVVNGKLCIVYNQ